MKISVNSSKMEAPCNIADESGQSSQNSYISSWSDGLNELAAEVNQLSFEEISASADSDSYDTADDEEFKERFEQSIPESAAPLLFDNDFLNEFMKDSSEEIEGNEINEREMVTNVALGEGPENLQLSVERLPVDVKEKAVRNEEGYVESFVKVADAKVSSSSEEDDVRNNCEYYLPDCLSKAGVLSRQIVTRVGNIYHDRSNVKEPLPQMNIPFDSNGSQHLPSSIHEDEGLNSCINSQKVLQDNARYLSALNSKDKEILGTKGSISSLLNPPADDAGSNITAESSSNDIGSIGDYDLSSYSNICDVEILRKLGMDCQSKNYAFERSEESEALQLGNLNFSGTESMIVKNSEQKMKMAQDLSELKDTKIEAAGQYSNIPPSSEIKTGKKNNLNVEDFFIEMISNTKLRTTIAASCKGAVLLHSIISFLQKSLTKLTDFEELIGKEYILFSENRQFSEQQEVAFAICKELGAISGLCEQFLQNEYWNRETDSFPKEMKIFFNNKS